jgi:hypothetical protein
VSKRTIKAFEAVQQKQAEQDAPANVLGCTCSNPECRLTWIVCLLPQPMRTITTITAKHKRCPNCGSEKPMLAKVGEIRPLLGDGA